MIVADNRGLLGALTSRSRRLPLGLSMADRPTEHDAADLDTSTSSRPGELPTTESMRDRVPELPNIGRSSVGVRNSIDGHNPSSPRAHHHGVANGSAPPQLTKVGAVGFAGIASGSAARDR